MLYGLDIDAGGTWFGTTRDGLVAMLTNVNEASVLRTATGDTPRSRGELVRDWLLKSQANADVQAYLDAVHACADAYSGFNLLVGVTTDGNATLGYVSNRPDPINDTMLEVGHAVYGLSNSTLSTPWPKVAKGEQLLCVALDTCKDEASLIEALFGMLRWTAGPVRSASEMQNTIRVEPFLFPSS
ncbi:hypothetical protein MVES_003352 [Malassezia vespertilionis]|uniref:Uncharacterized protein n=1 Tax=Malassezia vespertilionis TaxID=2020962 RepID=A0A2N1J7U9_9BASI|nr:hypothetical protein MVES_003352 [Malassezia vespertilionis]